MVVTLKTTPSAALRPLATYTRVENLKSTDEDLECRHDAYFFVAATHRTERKSALPIVN